MDAETISRFERGVSAPSLATLENLAQKLGVTVSGLLLEEVTAFTDDVQSIAALIHGLKRRERTFVLDLIRLFCRAQKNERNEL